MNQNLDNQPFDQDKPQSWHEHQVEIQDREHELKSPNPRVRTHAVKRLGDLGARPDLVVLALDDRNSFVRSAAAIALGFMPRESITESIVDRLIAAIHDSDDYFASAAIRSLGRLKINDSREDILACLDDPSEMIVQSALTALGRIGNMEDAPRIVEFLNHANNDLRSTAALAIATMNYAPAKSQVLSGLESILQVQSKPGTYRHRCSARYIEAAGLLQIREAVPLLIQTAQNQVGLRSLAVQSLVEIRAEEAVPMLVKMLADPSPSLHNRLMRLVKEFDPSITLPSMRSLFNNPHVPARQAALNAAINANDQESIPAIRRISQQDPSPFLRAVAVRGLATLLKQDALPDLIALLDDPNVLVRQAALECLERFDTLPSSAIASILQLANDSADGIWQTARAILSKHHVDNPSEYTQERDTPNIVPETVLRDAPMLLSTLEQWYQTIHTEENDSFDIMEVRQALETIINTLRRESAAYAKK